MNYRFGSMNGRYYRTSMDDIRSSESWLKNFLLLGLLYFVPVFGSMCVYGYSYEWAHKIAWDVKTPMPNKIFRGAETRMLRWGWFALVISVVLMIVPMLVYQIGSSLSGADAAMTVSSMFQGDYSSASNASAPNPFVAMFGGLLSLVGFVLIILATVFIWVGSLRMTIYDQIGPGLQIGTIWKMIKMDTGGIVRIFGMNLLVGLIAGLIVGALMTFVLLFAGVAVFGIAGGSVGSDPSAQAISMLVTAFPFLLVIIYVSNVINVFIQVLTARATGYWVRQFNVPAWGRKDDPLPFEPVAPVGQMPPASQPYQGGVPRAQQTPGQQPSYGAPAGQQYSQQPGTQPVSYEQQQGQPFAQQPVEQPAQNAIAGAPVANAALGAAEQTPQAEVPEPQPTAEQTMQSSTETEERQEEPAMEEKQAFTQADANASVEGAQAAVSGGGTEKRPVDEEARAKASNPPAAPIKKAAAEGQPASAGAVVEAYTGTAGAAQTNVSGGMEQNIDEEAKKRASNPPKPPGR